MISAHRQSGFSAVELLVTLFIAAAFLLAGYQLYTAIIRDSGANRQRARASNVAYDYLRQYAANAPSTCPASPQTVISNQAVTPAPDGLTNVRATVTYECAQSGLPNLIEVTTVIAYGSGSDTVTHVIYTSK